MANAISLDEAISHSVAAKLDSAFVEKEIDIRVQKLVSKVVDRALRSYSETGKLIEQKIEEALRVDRLDLPSYGETVSKILKAQIEAKVSKLVAGKLAADMDELRNLAPQEIRLSAIAEEMLQEHRDDGKHGNVITVMVERNEYGSAWVYLDEDEVHSERDKYQCKHRLLVLDDGTISGASIAHRDIKKSLHVGRAYGLEQKLRAYVACGTKLILDDDAVITGVGDY